MSEHGRRPPLSRSLAIFALTAAAAVPALLVCSPARAAKAGCEYVPIDVSRYGEKPLVNPPEIRSKDGVLRTTLGVQFTDPGTASIGGCGLHLRSYNGQLVGPTLRVKPGDVLDVLLDNRLPVESPERVHQNFLQESQNAHLAMFPATYNTTNLHTHGLHVSPTGNSDNVLLAIPAQTQFPYQIQLPPNHAPGSFWYHAHAHGSTSIQVGSGMGGALVVEDDPNKIPPSLRDANKGEKVLVLQTTLYNTDGELNDITALFPSPNDPKDCNKPENANTWLCSRREVTINGQIRPVITMRPGEVQRWRLVDAGFRQSFDLRLEGHALNEIALDGLYLGRVDAWPEGSTIELQPGYRSDVLVKASMTPGTYRLINGRIQASRAVDALSKDDDNTVALVKVEGDPVAMSLPTSAEMAPLAPFGNVDLRKTASGVQQVAFKLGQDAGHDPHFAHARNYFQVNYQSYDDDLPRKVVLGSVDQWTLSTVGDPADIPNAIPPVPHVFHIHVNPFQVVRQDPSGADELVWKDTVLVPGASFSGGHMVLPNPVNIYTTYADYIGQFVIHCHILDHEDLGMMQVVEVIEPESVPMRMMMQMRAQ